MGERYAQGMAACAKRGSLKSSTLTWNSVGLTWQMVQRTQTMYIEQRVPDRGRSPGFWWIPRGKTRSLAALAVRSTHNLIEVSQLAE